MRRLECLRHLLHFPLAQQSAVSALHESWLLSLRAYSALAQAELPAFSSPTTPVSPPGNSFVEVPAVETRILQAGILGVPNAGKSTLTNALVGQTVSAVSPKTNTTEVIMTGAFTAGPTQVLLYDMPGVVGHRHLLRPEHSRRVKSAWGTASTCDLLVVVVDAYRQVLQPDPRVVRMVSELGKQPLPDWKPPPAVLALNKVDWLSPDEAVRRLSLLAKRLTELHPFDEVFAVSATEGRGVPELKSYLESRARPGEWYLGEGEYTELSDEELAQEVVREKLFQRLRDELPYSIVIQFTSSRTLKDGSLRLAYDVLVPSKGARQIVVGTKGAVIGQVGIEARKQLEASLKRRVHLMLEVKIDGTLQR